MEETILRSQVFREVLNGAPFDMIWVTADRRRGTGGDLISAEGWMVCGYDTAGKNQASGVSVTELMILKEESSDGDRQTKDPNHSDNGTVNVFNPANSGVHPITVHWDLIQFFNGKRVIN